ncbi:MULTISPECIES: glutamine--fructose-6-phosphate transaminase (isomerizing) [unclassified Sporosarcina]|uniref:glutamine--fructose-6-phosphate transaminase (isomerizing) n=1 Tax=unclassified Sporosarcina TaxID=2647733 RepID=UPI00203D6F76|nr:MULTISPECIES: glutamine--fructose-6-phosphate transaminase (isomerizing) [unclassified Sporosarcina]GKV65310.1 glutamine--fructose-6-phosphate aminotransferase [isomerizing] [Sporosarcina sp. NCCP-2331]GLB55434.1 glutamine--fructose-6-phosphate aminotransferase [isomerizing] [Sporosarcina sp. NCCP-2378]
MCGITGYIGDQQATAILLEGLRKLEYRGYDSAGIALQTGQGTIVFKEKGRIADLSKAVDMDVQSTAGIGHTRWATHGVPDRKNSHPHQSQSGRFTLVHNGVIENYLQVQRDFLQGVKMASDTDTEVIVQLIEKLSNEKASTEAAFREALTLLHGSYAIAMLDEQDPDTLYVAKNRSPLLVGVGADCRVVASDAMAMLQVTDQFIELYDEEIVLLRKDGLEICKLDGERIERAPYTVQFDQSDLEKGTYPHYMLKEMDEQPTVIRKIVDAYSNESGRLAIDPKILQVIQESDRLYIIAAGTSYHAGLVGKQYFEKLAGIPVEVHISSEFGYNMPLLSKKPLFLFITQSGETADSRQVLVKVKALGYPTVTMTNVQGSTLSRESDYTLLLHAGPEIAVASTKAYAAQVAVLAISAFVCNEKSFDLKKELSIAANAIQTVLDSKEEMEKIVEETLTETRNAFFIGRNLDFYVSLEGALKLKEISYIQAEGFAGGELKHGTIALIEEGTPVFALATQHDVSPNIRGNVKEVTARGAKTSIFSMEGIQEEGDRFVLPHVHELLTPLVAVVPFQLISYYAALQRGCDVDQPRNLAKSVTVE